MDPPLPAISSAFPNPPPFYLSFTPANIAAIAERRRAYLESAHAKPTDRDHIRALRLPDVPKELEHLQPPPPPADGRWRVFGDQYSLDDPLPTLEQQGIDRLVSDRGRREVRGGGGGGGGVVVVGGAGAGAGAGADGEDGREGRPLDRAFELKKLAKSMLLNFLELVSMLSRSADRADDKINDLRTLFINFHHLLNEYRPHQARESAIALMQAHLDRTRSETVNIRSQTERLRGALEGLASIEIPPMLVPVPVPPQFPAGGGGEARAGGDDDGAGDGYGDCGGDDDDRAARDRARGDVWAVADAE